MLRWGFGGCTTDRGEVGFLDLTYSKTPGEYFGERKVYTFTKIRIIKGLCRHSDSWLSTSLYIWFRARSVSLYTLTFECPVSPVPRHSEYPFLVLHLQSGLSDRGKETLTVGESPLVSKIFLRVVSLSSPRGPILVDSCGCGSYTPVCGVCPGDYRHWS